MEKELFNQEMEERLLAYLNGELSESEREEVERWMAERSENREGYNCLMRDYLRIRWAQKEQALDEKKAKRLMLKKMDLSRIRRMWYGVAASVSLLLAVGGGLILRYQPTNPVNLAKEEVIKPGHTQAILVLSSGEQVDLTGDGSTIQEQDGSVVRVDQTKGVTYDTARFSGVGKLIYNKIVVPRGGEYFVTLCDGTKVWLNAGSELEFPVKFTGNRRDVKLKGEGYFSVTKDAKRPFVVQSGEYRLRVYGTEFNLNTYHSNKVEAVLVEGAIGFKANATAPERRLEPNQIGIANQVTGEVEIREVDVYPYIAWRTQDMVFVNESLESILEKAARWYDVEIFFQKESLKNLRFYGNMKRYADISELLFFLEKTSDVHFSVKDRTVIVSDK